MANKISRLVITLTVIGIISALVLTFVYFFTKPYIEKHQLENRKKAIFQVLPGATEYEKKEVNNTDIYLGLDENNNRVGVAVEKKGGGFQGMINLMIGVDLDSRKILGIKILKHEETPGLGARITGDFKEQFKGKAFADYQVVKNIEEGKNNQIEAITGATISSEKVTSIVEKAIDDLQELKKEGLQ